MPNKLSPVSYLTDAEYKALPIGERALHVARSQINVKEKPIGSNWGPEVRSYLRSVGLTVPAPWCGAFVSWCLREAGADMDRVHKAIKYPASTYWWYMWALGHRYLRQIPERGDIAVWNGANGGHMFFVAEVLSTERIRTLEGNTNDAGEREGYEVAERRRDSDLPNMPRKGYIRIPEKALMKL